MKIKRTERLAGEFKKEIYNVINGQLRNKHPELSTVISVTEADIAPDLKNAKIYISVFDKDEEKKHRTFDIISNNASFIRYELAHKMTIRTVPELRFFKDSSMEYGQKIEKILTEIENKNE